MSNGAASFVQGYYPLTVVFEWRLLQTIDFLSFTWGKTFDWEELLIDELASMAHEFVKWPQGAAILDIRR